jgi:hypothetical protein
MVVVESLARVFAALVHASTAGPPLARHAFFDFSECYASCAIKMLRTVRLLEQGALHRGCLQSGQTQAAGLAAIDEHIPHVPLAHLCCNSVCPHGGVGCTPMVSQSSAIGLPKTDSTRQRNNLIRRDWCFM